jgi:hypothetical protein
LKIAALIIGLATTTAAQELVRPDFFPVGEETCFGRVYDDRHLASHPAQRVTRFFLWNELTEDPLLEYQDLTTAEKREYDANNLRLVALLGLRGRYGLHLQTFDCGTSNRRELFCSVDCDGGYFSATIQQGSLLVANEGFLIEGVCDGGSGWLAPEPDDRTFRLDPLPSAACLRERDGGRPSLAEGGPPLRTRFEQNPVTCYERVYDDAHLAGHSRQAVAAMWLMKSGEEFTIGARLRTGETAVARAKCWPNSYSWSCFNPDGRDFEFSARTGSASDLSPAAILSRSGAESLTLSNHRNNLARLLGLPLGPGDDVFRLAEAEPASCAARVSAPQPIGGVGRPSATTD